MVRLFVFEFLVTILDERYDGISRKATVPSKHGYYITHDHDTVLYLSYNDDAHYYSVNIRVPIIDPLQSS